MFPPDTFLVSRGSTTGGVQPPAVIPSTGPTIDVIIARCADYNGDGLVSVQDVLNIARRFGARPGLPNWHPMFDLNSNNFIDPTDVLLSGKQFGRHCTI
jgi:hypothetical protein